MVGWCCKQWEVSERYGVHSCLKPIFPFVSLSQLDMETLSSGNMAGSTGGLLRNPHFNTHRQPTLLTLALKIIRVIEWNCPHFDLRIFRRGHFRCKEKNSCSKGTNNILKKQCRFQFDWHHITSFYASKN